MLHVYTEEKIPIKSWASAVEDSCLDQARNLARLPFAISHVALMPDAHPGFGMPIGGVLFADKAVVPYAVGVDIGCGVALLRTDLVVGDLEGGWLQKLLDDIAARVPVGNGPQAQHATQPEPFKFDDDVKGFLGEAQRVEDNLHHADVQLGTLGGGNHFIEVQADADDHVYVMLHSGSRSLGKRTCDHWHKTALRLNQLWHSALPDKELAYLPWDTDEAHRYWAEMRLAMSWAEENRRRMLAQVSEAVDEIMSASTAFVVDVHHNYAARESHLGRNGIIHRKGAVRACVGDTVLIPGSMGTASYTAEGLGNPASFESCQHGAGRARSRTATVNLETVEAFTASMTGILMGGNAANARDESPFAYKDIEQVMEDSTDLVRPVLRLRPLGVVKG